MEIIIALIAIVVIGAIWYTNRNTGFDANKDGKVDLKDAGVLLEQTVAEVKQTADVNKDGKVDSADVKVVAEKAKTTVKKAAVKAKTAVRNKKAKAPTKKA
jgi:preprotein translocase subunit SecF